MTDRIEHDSMGEVRVPADRYWGAQTQRSRENFPIGVGIETMPREITHAFGILKQAAARADPPGGNPVDKSRFSFYMHAMNPHLQSAALLRPVWIFCR